MASSYYGACMYKVWRSHRRHEWWLLHWETGIYKGAKLEAKRMNTQVPQVGKVAEKRNSKQLQRLPNKKLRSRPTRTGNKLQQEWLHQIWYTRSVQLAVWSQPRWALHSRVTNQHTTYPLHVLLYVQAFFLFMSTNSNRNTIRNWKCTCTLRRQDTKGMDITNRRTLALRGIWQLQIEGSLIHA